MGPIQIDAPVTGGLIQIGHGNQIIFQLKVLGAQDATLRLKQDDPLIPLLTQVVADIHAQRKELSTNGFLPTIAPPYLLPEDLRPEKPFCSPLGTPVPLADDAQQLANSFAKLSRFLDQLEQRFGGPLADLTADLSDGKQSLSIGDLLLQKGNLALWRFRRGALPLFAEQAGHYALVEPQDQERPELADFQKAAKGQLDIQRGWLLFLKYRHNQPALIDQSTFTSLRQGEWQKVLQQWKGGQQLPGEQIQAEQSYLLALGEGYESQQVQAAAQEAEQYYREALRRQPTHSAALVNLGALLTERVLLTYIETGAIDDARWQEARDYFQRAHKLLDQHPDHQSRVALLQCVLYETISFPPDALQQLLPWAREQTKQWRDALLPEQADAVNWPLVQRNLTWRHPSINSARRVHLRDTLFIAGGTAILVNLAEQWLSVYTHLLSWSPATMPTGIVPPSTGGHTSPVSSPVHHSPTFPPVHSSPSIPGTS